VRFAVDGDIKYLSHQDMIRMFGRAFARARLPIRYRQGFNPRPRISLPLPRAVGTASDVERLIVELTAPVVTDNFVDRLQDQLPRGIRIHDARVLGPADSSLPIWVSYRVDVTAVDPTRLRAAIDRVSRSHAVYVDRHTGGKAPPKRVDIRPFIDRVDLTNDGLVLCFRVTERGSARADEVCRLLGIEDDTLPDRIRRTEVKWQ
jgi:radical SAM-linked protein